MRLEELRVDETARVELTICPRILGFEPAIAAQMPRFSLVGLPVAGALGAIVSVG
jgi:hypothetical protein